jgi:hypothetical protein
MYGRRCSLIVGGKEAAGSCFTSLAAVRGGMGKHCPHQRGLASVMSLFELIGAVPPRCIRACAGRGSCALALVLALARLGLSKSLSSSELTAPTAHCAVRSCCFCASFTRPPAGCVRAGFSGFSLAC